MIKHSRSRVRIVILRAATLMAFLMSLSKWGITYPSVVVVIVHDEMEMSNYVDVGRRDCKFVLFERKL
jgi:hypothetical protein